MAAKHIVNWFVRPSMALGIVFTVFTFSSNLFAGGKPGGGKGNKKGCELVIGAVLPHNFIPLDALLTEIQAIKRKSGEVGFKQVAIDSDGTVVLVPDLGTVTTINGLRSRSPLVGRISSSQPQIDDIRHLIPPSSGVTLPSNDFHTQVRFLSDAPGWVSVLYRPPNPQEAGEKQISGADVYFVKPKMNTSPRTLSATLGTKPINVYEVAPLTFAVELPDFGFRIVRYDLATDHLFELFNGDNAPVQIISELLTEMAKPINIHRAKLFVSAGSKIVQLSLQTAELILNATANEPIIWNLRPQSDGRSLRVGDTYHPNEAGPGFATEYAWLGGRNSGLHLLRAVNWTPTGTSEDDFLTLSVFSTAHIEPWRTSGVFETRTTIARQTPNSNLPPTTWVFYGVHVEDRLFKVPDGFITSLGNRSMKSFDKNKAYDPDDTVILSADRRPDRRLIMLKDDGRSYFINTGVGRGDPSSRETIDRDSEIIRGGYAVVGENLVVLGPGGVDLRIIDLRDPTIYVPLNAAAKSALPFLTSSKPRTFPNLQRATGGAPDPKKLGYSELPDDSSVDDDAETKQVRTPFNNPFLPWWTW